MRLSNGTIYKIYADFIEVNDTEAYRNKYVPLPVHLNDKEWKWEGKDFPRVISLLEFREYLLTYGRIFDWVLSFGAIDDPEYEYLQYTNRLDLEYFIEDIRYDLHCLKLERKNFDFVLLSQIIEHLYDPILALRNVFDHMVLKGLLYINVPVNGILHNMPLHFCSGVTPIGLAAMVKLAGFDILKIGQWGNREYLCEEITKQEWPDYTYSDDPGRNELECPVITWCFAIKNHK